MSPASRPRENKKTYMSPGQPAPGDAPDPRDQSDPRYRPWDSQICPCVARGFAVGRPWDHPWDSRGTSRSHPWVSRGIPRGISHSTRGIPVGLSVGSHIPPVCFPWDPRVISVGFPWDSPWDPTTRPWNPRGIPRGMTHPTRDISVGFSHGIPHRIPQGAAGHDRATTVPRPCHVLQDAGRWHGRGTGVQGGGSFVFV